METLPQYTTELIAAVIGGMMVGALLYGIIEKTIDNWNQYDEDRHDL